MSVTSSHVGTSRREQKAATRQALKQAARRCLAERGYDATQIAHIAAGAGVAHGTFYVHFESKEVVVDELLAELNEELAAGARPVLAAAGERGVEATVRAAAELFVSHCEQHASFVECYAQRIAGGVGVTALRDGVNPPMVALLTAMLPTALGTDTASSRVTLAAHGLLALWLRVTLQYLLGDAVSREEAIDVLTRMTTGGLAGLAASRGGQP